MTSAAAVPAPTPDIVADLSNASLTAAITGGTVAFAVVFIAAVTVAVRYCMGQNRRVDDAYRNHPLEIARCARNKPAESVIRRSRTPRWIPPINWRLEHPEVVKQIEGPAERRSIAMCVAMIVVVLTVLIGFYAPAVRDADARSDQKAAAASKLITEWAADVYDVSAGVPELRFIYAHERGSGGCLADGARDCLTGTVIAGGTAQQVALVFIEGQPVLIGNLTQVELNRVD